MTLYKSYACVALVYQAWNGRRCEGAWGILIVTHTPSAGGE